MEKFNQALTLAKEKYAEKNNVKDNFNWQGIHTVNGVSFYLSFPDGDVNRLSSLGFAGIDLSLTADRDEFKFEYLNISLMNKVFDISEWLDCVIDRLNGSRIDYKASDFFSSTEAVYSERVIYKDNTTEKDNNPYKGKADVLDALLAKSEVIIRN